MLRNFAVLVCVAAVGAVAWPIGVESQQVFRSGTSTVPLFVTVIDANRRLVPGLVQDDFQIFDNGKPQPITSFDNQPQPITVAVMLDTSGSMTLALDLVKAGAEQFLVRLMPDDKGAIGYFNDKIWLSEFTGSRDTLVRTMNDRFDFGYPTRLYDGINLGLASLEGIDGRRVVLVFTDGDDTSSKLDLGDVLKRAREQDVMVYAIGLESNYMVGNQRVRSRPDRGLRKLAEETGGGYFELKKTAELNTTFTQVAQELHSQYVLAFTPELRDGKVHKLDVRMTQPGYTARARKTYLAAAPTTTPSGKK